MASGEGLAPTCSAKGSQESVLSKTMSRCCLTACSSRASAARVERACTSFLSSTEERRWFMSSKKGESSLNWSASITTKFSSCSRRAMAVDLPAPIPPVNITMRGRRAGPDGARAS